LGSLSDVKEEFRNLFIPDSNFPLIPDPQPGEWLAEHEEKYESYEDFVGRNPNKVTGIRKVIYFLPLGEFSGESPSLDDLQDYTSKFFQLEVKLLPIYKFSKSEFSPRIGLTNETQILGSEILSFLINQLPPDAYCLLGITMTDLYPQPSWNFIFGCADVENRVGVFSFYFMFCLLFSLVLFLLCYIL
jgi:archaemetzincin